MTAENIEQLLQDAGVMRQGHFRLTSGLHSPVYFEKFRILENPALTERLCSMIASHFAGKGIQVVAGPTTGGIILAHEVARQMGIRAVYAEKVNEYERAFRRGFTIYPGERILAVDDVLTTGKSLSEVLRAINKLGGEIAGIGVLIDRAEQALDFGVPHFACLRAPSTTYEPQVCSLCAARLPLEVPGSS